jgi:hypothetical protein
LFIFSSDFSPTKNTFKKVPKAKIYYQSNNLNLSLTKTLPYFGVVISFFSSISTIFLKKTNKKRVSSWMKKRQKSLFPSILHGNSSHENRNCCLCSIKHNESMTMIAIHTIKRRRGPKENAIDHDGVIFVSSTYECTNGLVIEFQFIFHT